MVAIGANGVRAASDATTYSGRLTCTLYDHAPGAGNQRGQDRNAPDGRVR